MGSGKRPVQARGKAGSSALTWACPGPSDFCVLVWGQWTDAGPHSAARLQSATQRPGSLSQQQPCPCMQKHLAKVRPWWTCCWPGMACLLQITGSLTLAGATHLSAVKAQTLSIQGDCLASSVKAEKKRTHPIKSLHTSSLSPWLCGFPATWEPC